MVLSPGTPPPGLSQTSVRTIGLASDANAWSRATSGVTKLGRVAPRKPNSSTPRSFATRLASAGLLLVVTITLAPRSGTSPAINPWMNDTDRISPVPSISLARSIKDRIGSRDVGNTSIIWQSNTALVGMISPRSVFKTRSTTARPVSTKSVWGNSLNATMTSAFFTRKSVKWLCGSKLVPITTSGPTIARMRAIRSPSQSR